MDRRTFLADLMSGTTFLASVSGSGRGHALEARTGASSNWIASKQWAPKTISIRPETITVAMGFRGEPHGSLAHVPLGRNLDAVDSVYGFVSSQGALTWTLNAAEAGDYQLAIIYRTTEAGSVYEFSVNGRTVAGTTRDTSPSPNWQLNFWRERFSKPVRLEAGKNKIVLRMTRFAGRQKELARQELVKGGRGGVKYKGTGACSFRVWSIELVRSGAMKSIEDHARCLRADGRWMVEGKYGLFIHWSPLSWPLTGPKLKYQDAVNLFDVQAFADMVEKTGAAWVFLTTTHGLHYFPGPIKAIDRIMPGLTCKRDLIAEIARALQKRGVRLCLYYHVGFDDPRWAEAEGFWKADKSEWIDNVCAIQTEINERYGKKTWGWFIDDVHKAYYPCNFPWARFTRILKLANPGRMIAYNPGTHPSLTPFGDLLASDNGSALRPPMPGSYYNKQFDHLLQHYSFTLEDAWCLKRPPHGIFPDPVHSTPTLIGYVRSMIAAGVPLTMNMLITQDVTRKRPFVNPKTQEQMKALRKAIRDI